GGTVVIGSGAKLTDSANLSSGYNPTGTITFTLYSPSNVAVYTDVVTVSGNSTYNTSTGNNPGGYLPTVAGIYHWVAAYNGDDNNNIATSGLGDEPETVFSPVTIGDYVWEDKNGNGKQDGEPGIHGVTVLLYR